MKFLIITNFKELSDALMRFLRYTQGCSVEPKLLTFKDLRIMSREILETEMLITEAYRLKDNNVDDKGVEIFLSFNRNGKKTLLVYTNSEYTQWSENLKNLLIKLPYESNSLSKKIKKISNVPVIKLSEFDKKILDKMFPYKAIKDHHWGHG